MSIPSASIPLVPETPSDSPSPEPAPPLYPSPYPAFPNLTEEQIEFIESSPLYIQVIKLSSDAMVHMALSRAIRRNADSKLALARSLVASIPPPAPPPPPAPVPVDKTTQARELFCKVDQGHFTMNEFFALFDMLDNERAAMAYLSLRQYGGARMEWCKRCLARMRTGPSAAPSADAQVVGGVVAPVPPPVSNTS